MLRVMLLWSFIWCVLGAQENIQSLIDAAKKHYPLHKNAALLQNALSLNLSSLNTRYIARTKFASKVSYQSDVVTLPFNTAALSGMGLHLDGYTPLSKDQYAFTLEISQPLLDMGISASKKMALAQYESQKSELEVSLYQVSKAVINVYFQALLLDSQIKQNALHIMDLEKNYDNIQAQYKNGVLQRDALTKMRIQIISAQKNDELLRTQKAIALDSLSALSGVDSIILESSGLQMPDIELQKQYLTQADAKDFMLRPEMVYFSLKNKEIATRQSVENAKNLPHIDAFLQLGYANPSLNILSGKFEPYYIAGVRLNWDFSNFYTLRTERELIQNARLQLDSKKEEFMLQTAITRNEIIKSAHNLLAQLRENARIITLYEDILRTQEARLKNGILSINDFITDINNLNLARLQQKYIEIEFLLQIFSLKQLHNVWE